MNRIVRLFSMIVTGVILLMLAESDADNPASMPPLDASTQCCITRGSGDIGSDCKLAIGGTMVAVLWI